MNFHFYQYAIGTAALRHAEPHGTIFEIFPDPALREHPSPFMRQLHRAFTEGESFPELVRRFLLRGLHFRRDGKALIADAPSLPLQFVQKGYSLLSDIPLALLTGDFDEYEETTLTEKYLYFYVTAHPFSQWHKCFFSHDGILYNSAEQFMMHGKAMLFGDTETAGKILTSRDVREQKALGRAVRNFDLPVWEREAPGIIYEGNKAKFTQNEKFREMLLSTSGHTLVEASPTDVVWGIGLEEQDAEAQDIRIWRGTNWLGIALTELREELSGNINRTGYLTFEEQGRRRVK